MGGSDWKSFLASPQACVIVLVLIFAVLRVFAAEPFYFVAVDEARYLELANNFPQHSMHAGTVFLQHMPAYPYMIALVDKLLHNDLVSGLLVSFLASVLALVVLLVLFKIVKKPNTWLFVFALLFSLNWTLVELSRLVFKETTYVAFFWASVVFFWLGLKKSRQWFWASGIAAAATALASDQVIFLFPVLIVTWLLVPSHRSAWLKALPLIFGGAAYAFWLTVRIQFYLSHTVAPIGVDGVIEDVSRFGILQVLSPFSFPESFRLTQAGFTLDIPQMASAVGYLFNTYPFLITPNLSRETIAGIVSPANIVSILIWYLPLLFLIGLWLYKAVRKTLKERLYKNNLDFIFAVYFAVLVIPVFTGVGVWRHILLAVVPLLYFETQALFMLFRKFVEKDVVRQGFVIIATVFLLSWIVFHPHLSFGAIKIVQGQGVAEELQKLPGDGIFVQTGYSMELDYLLDGKRVYGIVSNTSNLEVYLDKFNISYVVLGSKTWAPSDEPSLDFIKSRPDYFVPIEVVTEQYPLRNVAPDRFVVYRVNQSLVPRRGE